MRAVRGWLASLFLPMLLVWPCHLLAQAATRAQELQAFALSPVASRGSVEFLRTQFQARAVAAKLLGDYSTSLTLYKAWNVAMPAEQEAREALLVLLADTQKFDLAVTMNRPHFEAPDNRYSGQLNMAQSLLFAGRDFEAIQRMDNVKLYAKKEYVDRNSRSPGGWSPFRMASASLGQAGAMELDARLQLQRGRFDAALRAAAEGLQLAQRALDITQYMPPGDVARAAVYQSKDAQANLLLQQLRAYQANGNGLQAWRSMNLYLPLVQELEQHPVFFLNMGGLRYNEQRFAEAESYFDKADQAAQKLGYEDLSFFRVECAQGLLAAMEGQKKWAQAVAELQRLDALAGDDATLQYRIRYRFERAYVYLRTESQLQQAAELLAELVSRTNDGLQRANAVGLLGVTIWKMADPEKVQWAMPLLREAVDIYMQPIYLEDQQQGLNTDVRDLVVSTYLTVLFETQGADPFLALAPAEWTRTSSVQSALADAAARTHVSDPNLAALVRKDQDLKLEIGAIQGRPSFALDSSIRDQINNLNQERANVQSLIKANFPEYDMLVAPAQPTAAQSMGLLAEREAFVMLLPTDDAVFVWAMAQDGRRAAARVAVPRAELQRRVTNLRRSLDVVDMQDELLPFDVADAHALYRLLLEPVRGVLEGNGHYVIAAGGALGQIPLSVLLTAPSAQATAASPWLIKQAALSYVPSLGAWMALKQFRHEDAATEPLLAWGDPQFSSNPPVVAKTTRSVRRIALSRSGFAYDPASAGSGTGLRYADIPPLPETRGELQAIAQALHADPEQDLHLGLQATKQSVLQSSQSGLLARKRVVAFATHGLMAGDLPKLTQPALALAYVGDDAVETADKPDALSSLLTLQEVLGLQLNADWVILSACNTAAADGKSQEALSGLARGFFYAGSRSMLVTHWAVETESAKWLTTHTLAAYTQNPQEAKAQSLRAAMLALMQNPQYAHPAFWAPYALVGDGGR